MFSDLFSDTKPVIGCIHLKALPGAPLYDFDLDSVYQTALHEAEILVRAGADALIIENFKDVPLRKDKIDPITIAAMAVACREIFNRYKVPIGVNALRNDAEAALAIATATQAHFIRVNMHTGAYTSDQAVIEGKADETLRLRAALRSKVLIFADVQVKHAAPLVDRGLENEILDNVVRGLADAIIVSGSRTGCAADLSVLEQAKSISRVPVLVGSGVNATNVQHMLAASDGVIVGSDLKHGGNAFNEICPHRLGLFMSAAGRIRQEM